MYACIVPAKPAESARFMRVSEPFGRRSRSIEKFASATSPRLSSYVLQSAWAAKSLESMVAFIALSRAPEAPKRSSRSCACFSVGREFRFIAEDSVMDAPKPPIVCSEVDKSGWREGLRAGQAPSTHWRGVVTGCIRSPDSADTMSETGDDGLLPWALAKATSSRHAIFPHR